MDLCWYMDLCASIGALLFTNVSQPNALVTADSAMSFKALITICYWNITQYFCKHLMVIIVQHTLSCLNNANLLWNTPFSVNVEGDNNVAFTIYQFYFLCRVLF